MLLLAALRAQPIPLHARLAVAAGVLARVGGVELCEPGGLPAGALAGLHDGDYLEAFGHGVEPLASSQGIPWSPAVRDASYAMLAGQLEAARHAMAHGIAMNLARGFHHAVPERGSGFCPINGLALVAHAQPAWRVFVIDCDEHGGNGTGEFARRLPNLHAASVFGTRFGCHGGDRSWAFQVDVRRDGFLTYLGALREVRARLEAVDPDLVIYQAGVDCHVGDPKSRAGLGTLELFHRDLMVFGMVRRLGIPLVFNVAGGYQSPARVARLNLNTVRAARHVYRGMLA